MQDDVEWALQQGRGPCEYNNQCASRNQACERNERGARRGHDHHVGAPQEKRQHQHCAIHNLLQHCCQNVSPPHCADIHARAHNTPKTVFWMAHAGLTETWIATWGAQLGLAIVQGRLESRLGTGRFCEGENGKHSQL